MLDWIIRCLALILVLLLIYNQRKIKIGLYRLLPKKGPRFLVLSDFHNSKLLPFKQFEEVLEKERPDAFLLLGDLIDRHGGKEYTEKLLNLLKQTKRPVFYIHGNHEKDAPDTPWLKRELEGFAQCLEGKSVVFQGLTLTGIPYGKKAQAPSDLYLCHNPMEAVSSSFPGLYLAGHTHGGQVRIPPGLVFYVPGQPFFPKYVKGHYALEEKELLITSGLGNTLAPIRLFNPIEVLILE